MSSSDQLTDGELKELRGAFSNELLLQQARSALLATSPRMGRYLDWTELDLFDPTAIAPRDRERTLIALLSTQPSDFALGIHLYWGLMVGLSPDEVTHTLMLCGAYLGVPAYTRGALLLGRIVAVLKRRLAEGGDAIQCGAIARELAQAL